MRSMSINSTPVSAIAAAGVCTVTPDARFVGISVSVVSPLAARFPQAHQVQAQALTLPKGSYMGPETTKSIELVGVRGVPPRGRPV